MCRPGVMKLGQLLPYKYFTTTVWHVAGECNFKLHPMGVPAVPHAIYVFKTFLDLLDINGVQRPNQRNGCRIVLVSRCPWSCGDSNHLVVNININVPPGQR